jgi:REP element-mobilizing transposase RayT
MTRYDPLRHHRRSIRLKGYDYAQAGAYFVTLCTQARECLLGEVAGNAMRLNDWGRIVAESWEWLAEQYPYVELDEWVVMPNHMHGIIVLVNDDGGDGPLGRGGSRPAPTRPAPTTKRKPLGQLIGAFKTVSAKRINLMRGTPGAPVWQRNYYEHIVRDDRALKAIRHYIQNNPLKWALDMDNPAVRRAPAATADDYARDAEEAR